MCSVGILRPGRLGGVLLGWLVAAGALAAAPNAERIVSGRLVADDLSPGEVQVQLQPLLDNYQQGRLQTEGFETPEALATTSPNASSEFRLPFEAPGMFQVEIRAPGFLPLRYAPLTLTDSRRLPPAHLIADLGLRVEVHDSAGKPVEGAWVLAAPRAGTGARPHSPHGWLVSPRYGRTDAKGTLSLPRAAGEELELSVRVPGSFSQARTITSSSRAELRLTRSGKDYLLEVVDPEGRPAPEALVLAGEPPWPLGLTNERGRLEIVDTPSPPSPVQIFTASGDRLSATTSPTEAGRTLRFQLVPRRTLRGKVLRADRGLPLAGALVWSGGDPGRLARTGKDGEYEIAVPTEDSSFWIQAEAVGYLPRVETVGHARVVRGTAPTLALPSLAIQRGRVVDGSGQVVAGARVSARARQRPRAFRADPAAARTLSDERGAFALTLEGGIEYELVAELDGYTPARQDLERVGLAARQDLVLRPTRAAFGQVLDPEERPVAAARVRARAGPGAEEPWEASSDAKGRFSFPALPTTELDLEVDGPEPLAPFLVRGLAIPPGEGAFDLGTVILAEGAAITGRVVDARGEKVARAEIWREESGDRRPSPTRPPRRPPDTHSDEKGTFRLASLESGRRYDLWIRHPGHLPETLAAVPAPPEEPLELRLTTAGRLRGRVLDNQDLPLAGARVDLDPAEPPAGVSGKISDARSRGATTDAEGVFEITALVPGEYRLVARADGFIPSDSKDVDIETGQPPEDLELVLTPGHALSGRVLGPEQEAIPEVEIRTGEAAARSDAEGIYALLGLPLGEVRVEARHPRYGVLRRTVPIEPGDNLEDLVFPRGWPIAGRVEDLAGGAVEAARIRLLPGDARAGTYRAESDLEGGFRIESAAAGIYDLHIEHPDFARFRKKRAVQITGSPVEGLRLVLSPQVRLQGRVLGLEERDLFRVQVSARREGGGRRPGRVHYDGRFEIQDLSPGDWWLEGRVPGGRRAARQRVVIPADERSVERDVEFAEGISLTGEALLAAEPLAYAEVTLLDPSRGVRRLVTTDYAGEFAVADLEPGRYRLALSAPSQGVLHNEDLELFTDRHLRIDLRSATVAGVVRSALSGEPLAQSLVRLQQQLATDGPEGSIQTVGTDDEGRFRFQRLSAGSYRLDISRGGFVPYGSSLQVGDGQDTSSLEIQLEPSPGLELEILLASGQPARNVATVARLGSSGGVEAVESRGLDDRGRAKFSHVPTGTWTLWVQAPGGADQRITVESPGETRTVVLAPAGTLTVRLSALLTRSESTARVVLESGNGPFRSLSPTGAVVEGWPLVGGVARIPRVPAGLWSLRITAADGQTWAREVSTLGADQTLTLD